MESLALKSVVVHEGAQMLVTDTAVTKSSLVIYYTTIPVVINFSCMVQSRILTMNLVCGLNKIKESLFYPKKM